MRPFFFNYLIVSAYEKPCKLLYFSQVHKYFKRHLKKITFFLSSYYSVNYEIKERAKQTGRSQRILTMIEKLLLGYYKQIRHISKLNNIGTTRLKEMKFGW